MAEDEEEAEDDDKEQMKDNFSKEDPSKSMPLHIHGCLNHRVLQQSIVSCEEQLYVGQKLKLGVKMRST